MYEYDEWMIGEFVCYSMQNGYEGNYLGFEWYVQYEEQWMFSDLYSYNGFLTEC
jgi:hypothetical protein